MRDKRLTTALMLLPCILTGIALLILPEQVPVRYSSEGVQYGSKYIFILFPILNLWVGAIMLVAQRFVGNTEQQRVVKKIKYAVLIIFNVVIVGAILAAAMIREGKTDLKLIDIAIGIIVALIAAACAMYAFFTSRGIGPILSNSYLWLSQEEREKADKKAEYRMLTRIFGGLALAFGMLAINLFTGWKWAMTGMWIIMACVIIYAVYDSIRNEIKK